MFRHPRNTTRASRTCNVGQQGLEQLDARVVPSVMVATPYSPPHNQADVAFDENGNIKGGKEVKFDKLNDKTQNALDVKGIDQKYVYKLDKAIDLKKEYGSDDIWVKITEPSKKDDYGSKKDQVSDVLHIVTVHQKKDDGHGSDNSYGKQENKDVTYVSVFSDKDEKSYGDYNRSEKSDFDVGIPRVNYFDIKAKEIGPEDYNFATFTVEGKKQDVDFLFVSDGKFKTY